MSRTVAWPAGRALVRAHSHLFGSTEFDARERTDARFSPLRIDGAVVPVLYAGSDDATAAAETVFRMLPGGRRPLRVMLDEFRAWHWSPVAPRRPLALLAVDRTLDGAGELVDGDARSYQTSRRRASALLSAHGDVDGLAWASRQLNDRPSAEHIDIDGAGVCVLLVAARAGRAGGVERGDLTAVGPVVPFAGPAGLERLDSLAADLGVTVVRS